MRADARKRTPAADLAAALWRRYRYHRDPEARARLLDLHLGLVLRAAHELAGGRGGEAEFDQLVSAGTRSLIRALEDYEPARGPAFARHAAPVIRRGMLDHLQRRDRARLRDAGSTQEER